MGNSVSSTTSESPTDSWWSSIESENLNLNEPEQIVLSGLVDNPNLIPNIIKSEQKSQQIPKLEKIMEFPGEEDKEVLRPEKTTEKFQTLDEFKEELRLKRMARQSALADVRNEISELRRQLTEERVINQQLREGIYVPPVSKDAETCTAEQPVRKNRCADYAGATATECEQENNVGVARDEDKPNLRAELAESQLALQLANAEILSQNTELGILSKQVVSLKEVIKCSKEMLHVREEQVTQLKTKLREIEDSLHERELKIMSDSLRQEYDRQLTNIRNLRQLYDERARVSAAERENLLRQISIKKDELQSETDKCKRMEERVTDLETELTQTHKNLSAVTNQRNENVYENKELKEEMAVINQLFSQMLMGFNGTNNLDIDRLTSMLEDNRTLLHEMAIKEGNTEGACLPKLLFDIVKQANTSDEQQDDGSCSNDDGSFNTTLSLPGNVPLAEEFIGADDTTPTVASAQEIIGNLPKVWKVLIELLNHQKIQQVQFQENGQGEDCYKSVQTPTGPKAEISVSKTYIKLKDLILEKKALQKETNKLKTLNTHLERRMQEQEKRLSTVSLELTKTWHLVGKMQRQHRQLHTHEQILRYQLQQKRRLLNELKEELEYCRRKWAAARAKNDESQLQCDDLRKEFASRKLQDACNSAESGYSDDPGSDDDDRKPKIDKKEKLMVLFENPQRVTRMQSESPPIRYDIEYSERREGSAPPLVCFAADLMIASPIISAQNSIELQSVAASSFQCTGAVAKASVQTPQNVKTASKSSSGAIPKQGVRLSRSQTKEKLPKMEGEESLEEMFMRLSGQEMPVKEFIEGQEKRDDRAVRIQRLEDQCKSLIAQVIETSSCREELTDKLTSFKKELAEPSPQLEGTTDEKKQSTKPKSPTGLTEREEEYTAKRAERLKRLEEESNLLMSRIQKTTERGHNMKSVLDNIHQRCVNSREGSVDKAAGSADEKDKNDLDDVKLTDNERAYLERRNERLSRMEAESQQLLKKLSQNTERRSKISNKLDELHNRAQSGSIDVLDNTNKLGGSSDETVAENLGNYPEISSENEVVAVASETSRELSEISDLSSVKQTPTATEHTQQRAERFAGVDEEERMLSNSNQIVEDLNNTINVQETSNDDNPHNGSETESNEVPEKLQRE